MTPAKIVTSSNRAPTNAVWHVIAAAEIAKLLDGLPSNIHCEPHQVKLFWRGCDGSVELAIRVRLADHDVPIEVSGGGRVTEWRPVNEKCEVLNREHIASVARKFWAKQREFNAGQSAMNRLLFLEAAVDKDVEALKAKIYQIGDDVRSLRERCLKAGQR